MTGTTEEEADGMTFINDMYGLAANMDYDGYMTGVTLVSLYALLIIFSVLEWLNKR